MAESTVYLRPEAVGGDPDTTRLFHRSTVADGNTLNIIGLPPGQEVAVKVYRNAGATISVYSSTDDEATIIATTGTKQLWANGAVTADAEDMLSPGHTGIIVTTAGGTAGVEVVAANYLRKTG